MRWGFGFIVEEQHWCERVALVSLNVLKKIEFFLGEKSKLLIDLQAAGQRCYIFIVPWLIIIREQWSG